MKTQMYEQLGKLLEKYGPQELGKLCQKFVAIGFRMAGYGHVVERGVQGVDVDAAEEGGPKYAIEVKTTTKGSVTVERKDIEGLEMRKRDGYEAVLAVLRVTRFSDWIFVRADKVKLGSVFVDSLRPYRLCELEERIRPFIESASNEHFDGTMCEGQKYLDEILRQKGIGQQVS
jgi:Holliday junction resolvase